MSARKAGPPPAFIDYDEHVNGKTPLVWRLAFKAVEPGAGCAYLAVAALVCWCLS